LRVVPCPRHAARMNSAAGTGNVLMNLNNLTR
jgi:hypothetical protein